MNTTEKIVFKKENKQVIQQGKKFFTRVLENGEYFESGDFNTLERAKENLNIIPTTTENNKIIAEFLGYNVVKEQDFLNSNYDENLLNDRLMIDRQLKYNSDWNQLMQVIEKIESLDYVFAIHNETVNVFNGQNNSQYYNEYFEYKTKIESVFNACLNFIKWYNEQNK